jgi:hypothetical protein
MALFKDLATGNVTEFTLDWDIDQMRKHPDYVEVVEEVKPVVEKKPAVKSKAE